MSDVADSQTIILLNPVPTDDKHRGKRDAHVQT